MQISTGIYCKKNRHSALFAVFLDFFNGGQGVRLHEDVRGRAAHHEGVEHKRFGFDDPPEGFPVTGAQDGQQRIEVLTGDLKAGRCKRMAAELPVSGGAAYLLWAAVYQQDGVVNTVEGRMKGIGRHGYGVLVAAVADT